VPPESPVRGPADLAGVPVGVGYHSGSHFATYTREVFAATQAWTRRVFPALPEPAPYHEAVLS
jgi:hypothetical protein